MSEWKPTSYFWIIWETWIYVISPVCPGGRSVGRCPSIRPSCVTKTSTLICACKRFFSQVLSYLPCLQAALTAERASIMNVWLSDRSSYVLPHWDRSCRSNLLSYFLTAYWHLAILSWSHDRLVGLVVKASASRADGPGFKSCLRRNFSGVESYQWLKNWHSSGYPAWRLALQGQRWDCLARCQYTVTGEVESLICNFYLSVAARKTV